MKTREVFAKFDQALRYNGFAYVVQKITLTCVSFLLYRTLTTSEFATWATINSLIYLAALWLDFGLKRSVPLYLPKFATSARGKRRFIASVIAFKCMTSLIAALVIFWVGPRIFGASLHGRIFYLGLCIFVLTGLRSVVRLVFHSYFWQKPFNLMESALRLIYGFFVLGIVLLGTGDLLEYLFIADIILYIAILVGGLILFVPLMRDHSYEDTSSLVTPGLARQFVLHSGAMGATLMVGSLGERNVLVPLLAFTLGAPAAALYKIANDAALLFQRCIIKTIGTSDTSVLAHVQGKPSGAFHEATTQISKRCILFALPLLLLIGCSLLFFFAQLSDLFGSHEALELFALLSSSYLISILFTAYDRTLETQRAYGLLAKSALPYLGVLAFIGMVYYNLGRLYWGRVLVIVGIVHALRLLSQLIRITYGKKHYFITYPFQCMLQIMMYTSVPLVLAGILASIIFS